MSELGTVQFKICETLSCMYAIVMVTGICSGRLLWSALIWFTLLASVSLIYLFKRVAEVDSMLDSF